MENEAVLEVKMDADLKEEVEDLYKELGTSFAEAVRIFAKQSVSEGAMPFVMKSTKEAAGKGKPARRRLGIANGKYDIPDDIDFCNDEILEMFGLNE